MFGLPSIIMDRGPIETVISLGFSSIYTIGLNEFIAILKETPSDYVIIASYFSFSLYFFFI